MTRSYRLILLAPVFLGLVCMMAGLAVGQQPPTPVVLNLQQVVDKAVIIQPGGCRGSERRCFCQERPGAGRVGLLSSNRDHRDCRSGARRRGTSGRRRQDNRPFSRPELFEHRYFRKAGHNGHPTALHVRQDIQQTGSRRPWGQGKGTCNNRQKKAGSPSGQNNCITAWCWPVAGLDYAVLL